MEPQNQSEQPSEQWKNGFELKDYRQPMIASLGIMLGFILNFLAQWATESDEIAIQNSADWVVLITLLIALLLMFMVLYGLLTPFQPQHNVQRYYQRIFQLYLSSLIIAFAGIMLGLFL